jgi:phage terminase small subunit
LASGGRDDPRDEDSSYLDGRDASTQFRLDSRCFQEVAVMGKRGPPRTPTSVLKFRGSWRGNARGDEPEPKHDRPECPDWLSGDERAAWDRVVALLESMRVLTVADGAQLERYCRYLVRWRQCERIISKFAADELLIGGLTNDGMRPVIRNAWSESHRLATMRRPRRANRDRAARTHAARFGARQCGAPRRSSDPSRQHAVLHARAAGSASVVLIPGGKFRMGRDGPQAQSDEQRAHPVSATSVRIHTPSLPDLDTVAWELH